MHMYRQHDVSSVFPYQIYLDGAITTDYRNRVAAIDAWCESTWGTLVSTTEYDLIHRGWAFTQESHVLLLMITWC